MMDKMIDKTLDELDGENRTAGLGPRQVRLLEFVLARGFASLEDLAALFHVSTQTIRRDVIRLDAAGLLQRFHGGVGAPDDRVRLGYRHKQVMAIDAKLRIGALAAALVPDGAAIYLDVGTTIESLARELLGKPLRAVFTNNMPAALLLGGDRSVEVYVAGGQVRGADGSLVGEAAAKAMSRLAVDIAFLACSGFADDGSPMDFDPQKVAIKTAVLANARSAVLLADSSKFDRPALIKIADPGRFSRLVSDAAPPERLARSLARAGVELQVAAPG